MNGCARATTEKLVQTYSEQERSPLGSGPGPGRAGLHGHAVESVRVDPRGLLQRGSPEQKAPVLWVQQARCRHGDKKVRLFTTGALSFFSFQFPQLLVSLLCPLGVRGPRMKWHQEGQQQHHIA